MPSRQTQPNPGSHGESRIKKYVIGNALITASTIFWGVNYPFTKALIPEWMSANAISATRLVGGAVLFWLASLLVRNENLAKDDLFKAALGGVIGLFGCIFLFVLSLDFGSPIDIAIIMTLPPAFVILMETIFLHRRLPWSVYAGVVVCFIGAAMVILAGSGGGGAIRDRLVGDLMAVVSAICFAFYLVILSEPTDKYRPVTLLRWVFLFAAMPALFLMPDLVEAPIWDCRQAVPWLEIGFILFCPTFLAYLLLQPASRDIGSILVSLYQCLTPVVAAWAAIAMGVDHLRWQQAVAMLIIVAGVLLTNFSKFHK